MPIGSLHFRRAVEFGLSGNNPVLWDERVRTPRHRTTDGFPTRSLSVLLAVRKHFSTGRRIGLSLITTWSLVRVQPSAPDAGVAQR